MSLTNVCLTLSFYLNLHPPTYNGPHPYLVPSFERAHNSVGDKGKELSGQHSVSVGTGALSSWDKLAEALLT